MIGAGKSVQGRNMLKKLFYVVCGLIVTTLIAAFAASYFLGIAARTPAGKIVGYDSKTSEWLFAEYRNIPVGIDGPYVFKNSDGLQSITITTDSENVNQVSTNELEGDLVVTVDNQTRTQFSVPIRNKHNRSALDFETSSEIIAISDFEGNFQQFTQFLKSAKVLTEDLTWQFGTGHLVLIGDMVDRGHNVVPLLWLIYKLEAEAEKAGGKVHYVLGNHERYLLDGRAKSAHKKYFGSARATQRSHAELWSAQTVLGDWLRHKPVMVKINDFLFVHAGVSPEVLETAPTLAEIDEFASENLTLGNPYFRNTKQSPIHGSYGILFYRGFVKGQTEYGLSPKASSQHIENVLNHFDVKHVVIGHTLVDHVSSDYLGRIVRVDVDHGSGISEGLSVNDGVTKRINNDGERFELPTAEELTTNTSI